MTTTNQNHNVKYEKKSNILGQFQVSVEATLMKDRMNSAFQNLQKRITLPGFRAGKVPMDLVKKKHHEDVLHDVFQKVVLETYRGALVAQKVPAVGDPRITKTNLNEWEDGKVLEYTAEFDLLPDVSVKKYKGLAITDHSSPIKDEDVDIVLKGLLDQRAELINLAESTGVAKGHFVVIDFEGSLDGQVLPDATAKNFFMEVGNKGSLETFQDNIIGMRAGQSKKVKVDYPADFSNPAIAGKTVDYAVTVHEIKEKRFPELTDEIAKELQAENKADLLQKIRTSLETEMQAEKAQNQREEAIVAFLQANPFEVPQSLVQRQLQFIAQDVAQLLKRQRFGEGMIQEYLEKHWQDLNVRAEKEVKLGLLLPKVVEAEKIEVTDAELKEYLQEGASRAGNADMAALEKQYLSNPERKVELSKEVQRQKALRLLVQNASISRKA